jgi:hypothetical protein
LFKSLNFPTGGAGAAALSDEDDDAAAVDDEDEDASDESGESEESSDDEEEIITPAVPVAVKAKGKVEKVEKVEQKETKYEREERRKAEREVEKAKDKAERAAVREEKAIPKPIITKSPWVSPVVPLVELQRSLTEVVRRLSTPHLNGTRLSFPPWFQLRPERHLHSSRLSKPKERRYSRVRTPSTRLR